MRAPGTSPLWICALLAGACEDPSVCVTETETHTRVTLDALADANTFRNRLTSELEHFVCDGEPAYVEGATTPTEYALRRAEGCGTVMLEEQANPGAVRIYDAARGSLVGASVEYENVTSLTDTCSGRSFVAGAAPRAPCEDDVVTYCRPAGTDPAACPGPHPYQTVLTTADRFMRAGVAATLAERDAALVCDAEPGDTRLLRRRAGCGLVGFNAEGIFENETVYDSVTGELVGAYRFTDTPMQLDGTGCASMIFRAGTRFPYDCESAVTTFCSVAP